jgi:hypothetical protein
MKGMSRPLLTAYPCSCGCGETAYRGLPGKPGPHYKSITHATEPATKPWNWKDATDDGVPPPAPAEPRARKPGSGRKPKPELWRIIEETLGLPAREAAAKLAERGFKRKDGDPFEPNYINSLRVRRKPVPASEAEAEADAQDAAGVELDAHEEGTDDIAIGA